MSFDARDRPGVVLEQMRLHARCPGGLNVGCDIIHEETALRLHFQAGASSFEGTWVRLLDTDLVRVHDLLNQFVEVVQHRLPLPSPDEAVAQDAQPALSLQPPHIGDKFLVRRPEILRPKISHEGFELVNVETKA